MPFGAAFGLPLSRAHTSLGLSLGQPALGSNLATGTGWNDFANYQLVGDAGGSKVQGANGFWLFSSDSSGGLEGRDSPTPDVPVTAGVRYRIRWYTDVAQNVAGTAQGFVGTRRNNDTATNDAFLNLDILDPESSVLTGFNTWTNQSFSAQNVFDDVWLVTYEGEPVETVGQRWQIFPSTDGGGTNTISIRDISIQVVN